MNFPDSIARHVLSAVALIFGRMANISKRSPTIVTICASFSVSFLVERRCKGNRICVPTKNLVANLTPLRFCGNFTDDNARLIARGIVQRQIKVAVCFDFHRNNPPVGCFSERVQKLHAAITVKG